MRMKLAQILLVMMCWLYGTAPVLAASEAQQTLDKYVELILVELKRPEFHDPEKRAPILVKIEDLVREIFDFTELSKRTVGQPWKSFTPDQQSRFTEAFTDLLRATYIGRIEGYNGQQVAYLNESSNSAGDKVEVNTSILVDGKDVLVDYRMLRNASGAWHVYDVIVEGVSLVQNYRTQFQDVLGKGDAEELIKLVAQKAEEQRKQQNKTN